MRSCLALAMSGMTSEAASLAGSLSADRPKDTLLNELWLPMVRAATALNFGDAAGAIRELEPTERFEQAAEFFPQFLRGISHLHLDNADAAVMEFDKILTNRGEGPLSSLYPIANLGKARALNDTAEYDKFFSMWKDADADIPA